MIPLRDPKDKITPFSKVVSMSCLNGMFGDNLCQTTIDAVEAVMGPKNHLGPFESWDMIVDGMKFNLSYNGVLKRFQVEAETEFEARQGRKVVTLIMERAHPGLIQRIKDRWDDGSKQVNVKWLEEI